MKLEAVFSEIFSIPEGSVHDGLALRDIPQWDSMAHMLLIIRIEETWNIQFTGDEIADIKAVGDARQIITARGCVL
jgi:acyl carrier protein